MPEPATEEAVDLSTNTATKAVPKGDKTDDELDWLDEGHLGLDETEMDESLAEFPGRYEPKMPITSCRPNDWNPNEMNDKQFDMLCRRMRELGMISPIQVAPAADADTGEEFFVILGGEHRWRAAQAIGYKTIPALILTDERMEIHDMQQFVTMQLNMISGTLNPNKFLKMYKELIEKYESDALQDLMGFTEKHKFKMLTEGVAKGLPEGVKEEFEKRAGKGGENIKDPKDLQKILGEIMGKYGDDLRYNFMIFTTEGKEHIWCRLTEDNHKLASRVMDLCRTRSIDVDVVLEEAFNAALERFTGEEADAA